MIDDCVQINRGRHAIWTIAGLCIGHTIWSDRFKADLFDAESGGTNVNGVGLAHGRPSSTTARDGRFVCQRARHGRETDRDMERNDQLATG